MIVDAHQHVCWHRKDAAGLIADMDSQGIDVAWVLTWEIPPGECFDNSSIFNPIHARIDGTHPGMILSDALAMRDRYPDRVIVGYCPDPRLPQALGLFEAAYHMHGVRVCGEWKLRMLMDDPRCLNLYRLAGKLKCPVTFHIDIPYLPDGKGRPKYFTDWYAGTVDNLERALQACPDTIFLGHAPGFWRCISGDEPRAEGIYPKGPIIAGGRVHELLRRYPNLMADLSAGSARLALERDSSHAREFLIEFADRVLFARDYYGSELHDFLSTLNLPADVRDKIYFQNALRLVPRPGMKG